MKNSTETEYEPIELEWLTLLKIPSANIRNKTIEEKELFDMYQKKVSEVDHREDVQWKTIRRKFGKLTELEHNVFKRIYDEERSMVHLAYEGLIKTFGLDESENWCNITCEYDDH
jgi:hypothetical protein